METPATSAAPRGAIPPPLGVRQTAQAIVDELDTHEREMRRIASDLDAIRRLRNSLGDLRQEAYASVRELAEPVRTLESTWAEVAVGLAANRHPEMPLDAATTELITDILEQALTNVAQHAAATETNLSVKVEDRWIFVSVFDDGVGGAVVVPGHALARLQERVGATGGHFSISSPADRGTLLTVALPVTGNGSAGKEDIR
jgi:signal transduction histidine kinase